MRPLRALLSCFGAKAAEAAGSDDSMQPELPSSKHHSGCHDTKQQRLPAAAVVAATAVLRLVPKVASDPSTWALGGLLTPMDYACSSGVAPDLCMHGSERSAAPAGPAAAASSPNRLAIIRLPADPDSSSTATAQQHRCPVLEVAAHEGYWPGPSTSGTDATQDCTQRLRQLLRSYPAAQAALHRMATGWDAADFTANVDVPLAGGSLALSLRPALLERPGGLLCRAISLQLLMIPTSSRGAGGTQPATCSPGESTGDMPRSGDDLAGQAVAFQVTSSGSAACEDAAARGRSASAAAAAAAAAARPVAEAFASSDDPPAMPEVSTAAAAGMLEQFLSRSLLSQLPPFDICTLVDLTHGGGVLFQNELSKRYWGPLAAGNPASASQPLDAAESLLRVLAAPELADEIAARVWAGEHWQGVLPVPLLGYLSGAAEAAHLDAASTSCWGSIPGSDPASQASSQRTSRSDASLQLAIFEPADDMGVALQLGDAPAPPTAPHSSGHATTAIPHSRRRLPVPVHARARTLHGLTVEPAVGASWPQVPHGSGSVGSGSAQMLLHPQQQQQRGWLHDSFKRHQLDPYSFARASSSSMHPSAKVQTLLAAQGSVGSSHSGRNLLIQHVAAASASASTALHRQRRRRYTADSSDSAPLEVVPATLSPAASAELEDDALETEDDPVVLQLLSVHAAAAAAGTEEAEEDEEEGAEEEEGLPRPELAWHKVDVVPLTDPVTGRRSMLIVQSDVTATMEAELRMTQFVESWVALADQMFPRHVLEFLAKNSVAGHLPLSKAGPGFASLASVHEGVTCMFCDIAGFTDMSKQVQPSEVMQFLNTLFSLFDDLIDKFQVYKVETAGDCYIVAGGLMTTDEEGFVSLDPHPNAAQAAERVLAFAKAMLLCAKTVPMPHNGQPTTVRVGMHTGPCTSGLIGSKLPKFSIFGDTMNTASRMESTSRQGCIQISEATHRLLASASLHAFAPTGGVEVKGKGRMDTYIWDPEERQDTFPSGAPALAVHAKSQQQYTHDCAAAVRAASPSCDGGASSLHSLSAFQTASTFTCAAPSVMSAGTLPSPYCFASVDGPSSSVAASIHHCFSSSSGALQTPTVSRLGPREARAATAPQTAALVPLHEAAADAAAALGAAAQAHQGARSRSQGSSGSGNGSSGASHRASVIEQLSARLLGVLGPSSSGPAACTQGHGSGGASAAATDGVAAGLPRVVVVMDGVDGVVGGGFARISTVHGTEEEGRGDGAAATGRSGDSSPLVTTASLLELEGLNRALDEVFRSQLTMQRRGGAADQQQQHVSAAAAAAGSHGQPSGGCSCYSAWGPGEEEQEPEAVPQSLE